jgi:hypothetical protein
MTTVRLRYVHSFVDRHGHARYYFRIRGQRWPLPPPGRSRFHGGLRGLQGADRIRCRRYRARDVRAWHLDGLLSASFHPTITAAGPMKPAAATA